MTTESAATPVSAEEIARLEDMARRIRVAVIRTVTERKVGHVGGPLSSADVLAALYGRIMRIRPDEPDWPDRDRFILSKISSNTIVSSAPAAPRVCPMWPLSELTGVLPPTTE